MRTFLKTLLVCSLALVLMGVGSAQEQSSYSQIFSPWHLAAVEHMAATPEGTALATTSIDGQLFVWSPPIKSPKLSLQLDGEITALALSPHGHRLAVALSHSDSFTIHLYDTQRGVQISTLSGHSKEVNALAFHPSSGILASASRDKTVRLWNPNASSSAERILQHKKVCRAVAFSAQGLLASASGWEFGKVHLWNPETGQHLRDMTLDTAEEKAHPSSYIMPSNALAFSEDGESLASASYTGVELWDTNSGLLLKRVEIGDQGGGPGVLALRFHRGQIQAWQSPKLYVIEPESGLLKEQLELAPQEELRFVANREGFLLGSLHGKVALTDASGQATWTVEGPGTTLSGLAFLPGETKLLASGQDGTLFEWDADKATILRREQLEKTGISALRLLPNGESFVYATGAGDLVLCSYPNLKEAKRAREHKAPIRDLQVSSDGKLLLSASQDGTIGVWDLEQFQLLRKLRGHEDQVTGVALSPDQHHAVSVSEDGTARAWDLETGKQLKLLQRGARKSPYSAVRFHPDGRSVVAAEVFLKDQPLVFWSFPSGELLRTVEADEMGALSLEYHPNGELLCANLSSSLTFVEPRSGQVTQKLQAGGYGWRVAVSSDGRYLALSCTGQEASLRIWRRP